MNEQRLNKRLVQMGLASSRRKADELILQGRVAVNGKTVGELGSKVEDTDEISLDGKLGKQRAPIYVAYYKPRGLVCSHVSQGRTETIFDQLPKSFKSLKIAGRLDKDSEGLMILSSDGDFNYALTHPSGSKSKAYIVTTKEEITQAEIDKINAGIKLEDGTSNMNASLLKPTEIKIVMSEGKNRQIRRTLEAISKAVIRLQRVRIGDYSNPNLQPGKFEFIKPGDVI